MLARLNLPRLFPLRFLSSIAWREKLAQGPSLKSFLAQTNQHVTPEPTLPPYLSPADVDNNDESFDPLKHPKRRVYFDVYGCQMNENDTDIAYAFLDKHGGYQRVEHEDDADVVL